MDATTYPVVGNPAVGNRDYRSKTRLRGLGKSARADLVSVGAISNRLRLWRLEEIRRLEEIWRLETATTGAKPAHQGLGSPRRRTWFLSARFLIACVCGGGEEVRRLEEIWRLETATTGAKPAHPGLGSPRRRTWFLSARFLIACVCGGWQPRRSETRSSRVG